MWMSFSIKGLCMELNDVQKKYIDEKLKLLSFSKFRSSFHLRKYMRIYIEDKGWDIIEMHCAEFIEKNLSKYPILNDGRQTPMKNHPVFIAQHATATCCRKCIFKWYKIPNNRELTDKEKKFIKALIMEWLKREYFS